MVSIEFEVNMVATSERKCHVFRLNAKLSSEISEASL